MEKFGYIAKCRKLLKQLPKISIFVGITININATIMYTMDSYVASY